MASINRSNNKRESDTRLYKAWMNMKNRCLNHNSADYPNYGGRGIKICESWLKSYACFKDWAVSNGYAENLSIDRIDVDGDYCPENCRWATSRQQSRNTRKNIHVEVDGFSGCLLDYCDSFGLNYHTVISRLNLGWPLNEAIKSPGRTNYKKKEIMLTYRGKTMNATAWCKELGIPKTNLFRRLDKGWDAQKCFETPFRKRRKKEKY